MNIEPAQVKTYSDMLLLMMDIRNRKQKRISISEGGGFPKCIELSVRLARQFWYINTLLSVGVIADSDIGPVYNKLVTYLNEYLQTPCKKHNVNPQLSQFDSDQRLTISFGDQRDITMWTLEIPERLETQISYVLKRKYPQLSLIHTDNEIIKAASNVLQSSKEDIIRSSVKLLENEKWFKVFVAKLEINISR